MVFDYVADFRTLTTYNPSVQHVRVLGDHTRGEGSSFGLTLVSYGLKLYPTLTVTGYKRPEFIATKIDAVIPAKETRYFRQLGHQTEVRCIIEFTSLVPVIGTVLDYLLAKLFAEPQARTELKLLKAQLESENVLGFGP